MKESLIDHERKTSAAFSKQAESFDRIYGSDEAIRFKRERVREHILKWLSPNAHILELNCGTGEDALFFAEKGHKVHATDASEGMLQVLRTKIIQYGLEEQITQERCSFTRLDQLQLRGPYDLVFSNFGGLNCTGELKKVLNDLDPLVRSGGIIVLVIISDFSLWETSLFFRGKWKTAFRRWFAKKGAKAKVEGLAFTCWYYSPSFVRKCLSHYKQLSLEGLCTVVPPSYIQGFHQKYPRLYQWLVKMEDKLRFSFPWRRIGDYFIISFRKP